VSLTGAILIAAATSFLASDALAPATVPTDSGMIEVAGGTFQMGNNGHYADETPVHEVEVGSFLIDATETTNREFAAFVEATNYVTQAEKDGFCWSFLEGGKDFEALAGANWRRPYGPDSSIDDRMDHPVVCVSWEDAAAYAEWAGKRLPTEAEWEYAARAGATGHATALGSGGHEAKQTVPANIWRGNFPEENLLEDGYFYTAPVGSFAPNDWGIHDMLGNVWEWCADWYGAEYYAQAPRVNPQGPDTGQLRVVRGGSWFCSSNYCGAYTTHYRGSSPPSHTFNNVGFRCVKDKESEPTI